MFWCHFTYPGANGLNDVLDLAGFLFSCFNAENWADLEADELRNDQRMRQALRTARGNFPSDTIRRRPNCETTPNPARLGQRLFVRRKRSWESCSSSIIVRTGFCFSHRGVHESKIQAERRTGVFVPYLVVRLPRGSFPRAI
jgi:hypothetical protein